MERILTNEEISIVNEEFQKNSIYRHSSLRKMYREDFPLTEILSVSEKNNLIMIKGNSDTGYDHIRERHNFFTTNIYTKTKENGEIGFQNPSKFPSNLAPMNFLKIADEIFLPINEVKDNKNEGSIFFDLYVSNVILPNIEKPEPVRLLLYKNTKIIHTLFPIRDTFSRKIKRIDNFLYHRDVVDIEYFNNDSLLQIRIPYVDVHKKLWYAIFVEKNFTEDIENWSILVFLGNHISKYKIDYLQQRLIKFNLYRSSYQYADLRTVEKYIKEFDEKFKAGMIEIPK